VFVVVRIIASVDDDFLLESSFILSSKAHKNGFKMENYTVDRGKVFILYNVTKDRRDGTCIIEYMRKDKEKIEIGNSNSVASILIYFV